MRILLIGMARFRAEVQCAAPCGNEYSIFYPPPDMAAEWERKMNDGKDSSFSITPCAVSYPTADRAAASVAYKPYCKDDDTYIEEENGWFEEQGVKCGIQHTAKNSIATRGHLHDALEIIYIKSGTFTAQINDAQYSVYRGDMLFFRSGDIHRIYSCGEENNIYYVIKIHPSLVFDIADKKNGAAYMLKFSICDESAKRVWRANELEKTDVPETIRTLAEECRDRLPYFDISVRRHAAALLLFLLRNENADGRDAAAAEEADDAAVLDLIYKSLTYINSNYFKDISASDVAAAVGMSYSRFSHSFGSVTGRSFKEYLNLIRVKKAEELLITTDDSISEITEKCGYCSPSYFILTFKRAKGITPHAYRATLKGGRENEAKSKR